MRDVRTVTKDHLMPLKMPMVMLLARFVRNKSVRGKAPLIFLTNRETKKFLAKAIEAPRLPKGPSFTLIPWPPDGTILRPCASTEENIVCIPTVRWTPMGPMFVCRCHRLPGDDGGGRGSGCRSDFSLPVDHRFGWGAALHRSM